MKRLTFEQPLIDFNISGVVVSDGIAVPVEIPWWMLVFDARQWFKTVASNAELRATFPLSGNSVDEKQQLIDWARAIRRLAKRTSPARACSKSIFERRLAVAPAEIAPQKIPSHAKTLQAHRMRYPNKDFCFVLDGDRRSLILAPQFDFLRLYRCSHMFVTVQPEQEISFYANLLLGWEV